MKEENIILSNDLKVPVDVYEAEKPKAICLIIHGMQEHKGRYVDFANVLMNNDITTFVPELRGHGEFWPEGEEGYDAGDIFENIVLDMKFLIRDIKSKYDIPLVIFGHSFGSFITQRLIRDNVPADKFVLSGSSYAKNIEMKAALCIAKLACLFKKDKNPAVLIEKLSFGKYAKKYPNGNWLSNDDAIIEAYRADKYCGHPFPYSFYKSFFGGVQKNYKKLRSFDRNHEILIVSGDKDPVGKNGRLVKKLFYVYKSKHLPVSMMLFKNDRHEILNELDKDKVYSEILKFFDEK